MIFVDTGAWFAAFVPRDPDREVADTQLQTNRRVLLTTDYILDELLTLMRSRGAPNRARQAGTVLLNETFARLEWVTPADVRRAWEYFQYPDKGWSFTDCVSRAVVERLRIAEAFTFDAHFHQFGTVRVVP